VEADVPALEAPDEVPEVVAAGAVPLDPVAAVPVAPVPAVPVPAVPEPVEFVPLAPVEAV
jgi:hypothetical protein